MKFKNVEIKFPYVITSVRVKFTDIENHPDRRVKDNVLNAIGSAQYIKWREDHRNGIDREIVFNNRFHIKHYLTDPIIMSQVLSVALVVGGFVAAAGYGLWTIIKFLIAVL